MIKTEGALTLVTIKDVSQLAGVSKSTVSRYIAENGYVSEEKRKAIEEAIRALDYRPNKMARGLRSSRSDIVGLVVGDVASQFYALLAGGAQTACREAGKSLLVTSGYADQGHESRAIVELLDRSCDGLILYLENPLEESVAKLIQKSGLPVVVFGHDEYGVAHANVAIDNRDGAYRSMKLLLEKGHRKIAHLTGPTNYRDTRDRLSGVKDALSEFGMSCDDIMVEHGQFWDEFGYEATRRLILGGQKFTAIFAGDDDIAAGCMQALKHHKIDVPKDVSVIGFDDNFHARYMSPALTTNRQPIEKAGEISVELLLDLLKKNDLTSPKHVLKTELIERESVSNLTGL